MTQVKITELPAITSLAGSEVLPVVQAGTNYKATLTQAQNFMGVYNGAGIPSMTVPDGSVYLRSDGSAATTMYIRADGAWSALGAGGGTGGATLDFSNFSLGINGWQAQFDEGWAPTVIDWAISASIKPSFIRFNFLRNHDFTTGGGTFIPEVLSVMQTNSIGHALTLFYGADPWDSDYTGFAAWSLYACNWHITNYPGVLKSIEIWNEPDGNWPANPSQHDGMVNAIRSAIRNDSRFDAIPLCGPTITRITNHSWWDYASFTGTLNNLDVISHHEYANSYSIDWDFPKYRAAVGSDSAKPVYVSEWGGFSDEPYHLTQRLSLFKYLGIQSCCYYIVAFTPSYSLLDNEGTANVRGTIWREWNDNVGTSATFVSRDSLNNETFSLLFNKADGTPIRHMFSRESTPILVNGVPRNIVDTPQWVTGTATVAMATGADTLKVNAQHDFDTVSSSGNGTPYTYIRTIVSTSAENQLTPASSDAGGNWRWWYGNYPFVDALSNMAPYTDMKVVRRYSVSHTMTVRMSGNIWRPYNTVSVNSRVLCNNVVQYERSAQTAADDNFMWLVFSANAHDNIDQEIYVTSGVGSLGGEAAYFQLSIFEAPSRNPTDFFNFNTDVTYDHTLFYGVRVTAGATETGIAYANTGGGWSAGTKAWVYSSEPSLAMTMPTSGTGPSMTPGSANNVLFRLSMPKTTAVRIRGKAIPQFAGGDGARFNIYANRSSSYSLLYTNLLTSASATASYDLTATIAAMHSIEFEVGNGGAGDVTGDTVTFQSAFFSIAVS